MPVKTLMPGEKPFAPMSDINARMPPSPRLSARMTMRQYLIDTVMIRVQNTSDSTPSALCGVKCPPVACTTVCRVYKGLVPRSPNTTPSAPKAANPAGRPWLADSPLELLVLKFVAALSSPSRDCAEQRDHAGEGAANPASVPGTLRKDPARCSAPGQ